MTVLSTDTCQRADQSGLGTASDGETYTINGTFTSSISGNEATIKGSSGFTSALLGTQTTADINFLVRVTQNNSFNDGIGPQWRSDATGANCYFVALYQGTFLFAKLVSGGFTQIIYANVSDTINTFYWIRVSMTGSHLQARIWQDGTSEPGTWTLDTTDTTFSAAGRYGMSFNTFAAGSDTVQFDHITVTDNTSAMNMATLARDTFKVRAALNTEMRATWKIRAVLTTETRASWKIRAILAAVARSPFKIRAVLDGLARAAFKVRSVQSARSRATFKIDNVMTQQVPGIATISDAAHGSAAIGDVLVDQATAEDVAVGSAIISDQG